MPVHERMVDQMFYSLCIIALGLWMGEWTTILTYWLFALGFGRLAFVFAEVGGLVKIIRPGDPPSRDDRTNQSEIAEIDEVGTEEKGIKL